MPSARLEGGARDRATLVRRVLIGLFFANLAVVIAKLLVGLAAHSLAVLGDALHSSVDAVNNVLALVVVRVAARAPDEDHPYGHGKFESLGALALVGFLSITCFELARGAGAPRRLPPRAGDLQPAAEHPGGRSGGQRNRGVVRAPTVSPCKASCSSPTPRTRAATSTSPSESSPGCSWRAAVYGGPIPRSPWGSPC
jgi:cation efflux family protein